MPAWPPTPAITRTGPSWLPMTAACSRWALSSLLAHEVMPYRHADGTPRWSLRELARGPG